MSLHKKRILPLTKTSIEVNKLYATAFPPEERLPYFFLLLNSFRKSTNFVAYYDQQQFVGFIYTIENDDLIFILFLAVNPKIQSKGYGTQILKDIQASSNGKPLLLTIEPIMDTAPNIEQRQKRLAFYQRQGFHLTNTFYHEGLESYQIMVTDQTLDLAHFEKMMKHLFLGLIKVSLKKHA